MLPQTRTRLGHHAQFVSIWLMQIRSTQQVAIMFVQAIVVVGKTVAHEKYFFRVVLGHYALPRLNRNLSMPGH